MDSVGQHGKHEGAGGGRGPVGRQLIGRSVVVLVAIVAGAVAACGDMPSTTMVHGDPPPKERLSEIAYAISSAMASETVRLSVLAAMRASPGVDHHLILGEYLQDRRSTELRRRSASALGITEAEFVSRIQGLPELEFAAPFTEHRLSWTGTAGIGVAAMWDPDVLELNVFEPSGSVREVRDATVLLGYEALVFDRPARVFRHEDRGASRCARPRNPGSRRR